MNCRTDPDLDWLALASARQDVSVGDTGGATLTPGWTHLQVPVGSVQDLPPALPEGEKVDYAQWFGNVLVLWALAPLGSVDSEYRWWDAGGTVLTQVLLVCTTPPGSRHDPIALTHLVIFSIGIM